MATFCSVVGCSNSYRKLKKWRENLCAIHRNVLHEDCPCLVPYKLHKFPSKPDKCREWITALRRKDFVPKRTSAVCSVHFFDGMPTEENPFPQISLGYSRKVKPGRRELEKNLTLKKPRKCKQQSTLHEMEIIEGPEHFNVESVGTEDIVENTSKSTDTEDLLETCQPCNCSKVLTCNAATQWEDMSLLHHNYVTKASSLLPETKDMQIQVDMPLFTRIDSNNTCKFYTGLSLEMFSHLVTAMKPFAECGRKMCLEDQLLLVLMRLRLGLLYEDLARRFHVSVGLANELFTKWNKIMSINLKKAVC